MKTHRSYLDLSEDAPSQLLERDAWTKIMSENKRNGKWQYAVAYRLHGLVCGYNPVDYAGHRSAYVYVGLQASLVHIV